MRLLKRSLRGGFDLVSFNSDDIPDYAILSHTWTEGQEITYDELLAGSGKDKTGYEKIRFCGDQAAADRLEYFWVDTCCIKKSDIVELSTAINSMFRWYKEAAICYVFLTDVSTAKSRSNSESFKFSWEPAFRSSRWFTRGWTLQELLAPRKLQFFSREEKLLGSIHDLMDIVHDVTDLPTTALEGASLDRFQIEERLAWTKDRRTTRREDKVYSLLGLFGIFMPLIYGEGELNAFRRLRKEIQERRYATQGSSPSV